MKESELQRVIEYNRISLYSLYQSFKNINR